MIFNIFKITILPFLFAVVSSCQQNDIANDRKGLNPNAISFRTDTGDDFATRSAGYNTNAPRAINSMGVFAAYTDDPWVNTDSNNNFMSDLRVERSNAVEPWQYTPEHLWPGKGYLSFFGYAPHRDHPIYNGNKPMITETNGIPKLSYVVAATHEKQVDLLIATPLKDQTKRDFVTMPLRHALTKIAFSARLANPAVSGTTYKVTKIVFDNILNSGTISMDGSNRVWNADGSTATYTQNIMNGGLSDLALTSTYQSLTPVEGHLFLLPQLLTDVATVTITYEVTTAAAPIPVETSKTMQLNLAIARWNPGDAYNMMFSIDNVNGTSFIVAPTPWDDTEIKADIKNRILNVTRIEANVYPGVATRIHFWSNQPKDSVYVRKSGNIDVAKYPTGASYIVNSVFQDLSGVKTDIPAYTPNIVYSGFDGVSTVSGEGYIDVLHVTNTTSPFLPVLAPDDKRHIWLNASGLTRNIRLNSVIRGNPTTTPYVGTFHRWNETGERIVTWGFNGDWTAEVVDEPSVGAILIDNLPSPFMASGQLYGDGDVGDPEAAQLRSTAINQISGKGRVYFRVGWASRLYSSSDVPRYGRIQVSGPNIGGAGIDKVYLYIRQGERADFVYEPDGENPYAVKWSPYNLTAKTLIGTTQSVQITANRSNAAFVQYPTQAGGIFQWANATYQRYAYNPTNPIGTPSPWSSVEIAPNIFWNSLMATHENCPQGYRRPNDGSITAYSNNMAATSELRQSLFEEQKNGIGTAPTNTNSTVNSAWGYYADGFFDRRKIMDAVGSTPGNNSAVLPLTAEVGYIGRIFFYNIAGARARVMPIYSLFFPAAGARPGSGGDLYNAGRFGFYDMGSLGSIGVSVPIFLLVSSNEAFPNQSSRTDEGHSIRCVRDIGFSTELPDYNETVIPTALGYTAFDPAINEQFINRWNGKILNDVSALPVGLYNIRAKVIFTGTVAAGSHKPSIDGLIFSSRFASGSTITYNFTQSGLVWNSGTQIEIEVTDNEWEFSTDGVNFTQGGIGKFVKITSPTNIVIRKR